jgi:four helix bundle protein
MKVERFEDLICWQKGRALTNLVYELTRLPMFARDFELIRQIRGAAISAMSNIAEGFDRWSRKELVRFLDIAKGSAGEVRSQLYVALDQQYVTAEQFQSAMRAAEEVSKTIGGLIGHLERKAASYVARESDSSQHSDLDLPTEFCNPLPDPTAYPNT